MKKKFSELKVVTPKGSTEGVEVTSKRMGNELLVQLSSNKGRGGVLSLSFRNTNQLKEIGKNIARTIEEFANEYEQLENEKTEELRKELSS